MEVPPRDWSRESVVTEFVAQHSMLHPSNRDQIIERLEQAVPHAVFGDPMNARIMPNRHLGHGKTMHQGERRKKSVHSLKQANPLQHRAPKDFERAACIMDTVMSKHVSNAVRDSRGEHLHEAVLSLLPPSADQVMRGGIGDQLQDIFAVLLKVSVDLDDDLACGLPKAGLKRASLAVIAVEVKYADLSMIASQSVQLVAASVAAPIVNEENLVRAGA
ncbi:hypothetical protein COMA2_30115 [Candidatus Nitrospira nitrificans]|uniref:Uncharacterized protein n=1 Tax=Candidatus Nitrospira nitrificans TaxID=1742973 RepID=A0A0S4LMM4_9BACT|nr:hypothetical protein COMA2_30115 [Candidatus Nitrospira nitrificans]